MTPPKNKISGDPHAWGTPWVMLSNHTEFHPIWSSRRDAVASPDLEIIDGIYCRSNLDSSAPNCAFKKKERKKERTKKDRKRKQKL